MKWKFHVLWAFKNLSTERTINKPIIGAGTSRQKWQFACANNLHVWPGLGVIMNIKFIAWWHRLCRIRWFIIEECLRIHQKSFNDVCELIKCKVAGFIHLNFTFLHENSICRERVLLSSDLNMCDVFSLIKSVEMLSLEFQEDQQNNISIFDSSNPTLNSTAGRCHIYHDYRVCEAHN